MNESEKAQKALDYYLGGYNCGQAVFAAFHEEMGLDEAFALRLGSSLGGGMGGLREICGAVSSMFAVLGALKGYDTADDMDAKRAHYAKIQRLAEEFKQEYGTYNCRELLIRNGIQPVAAPAERTPEYYKKRPCARYGEYCARMTVRALQEN